MLQPLRARPLWPIHSRLPAPRHNARVRGPKETLRVGKPPKPLPRCELNADGGEEGARWVAPLLLPSPRRRCDCKGWATRTFCSTSMMRSIKASIPSPGSSFRALDGTASYHSPVTARKDPRILRIASVVGRRKRCSPSSGLRRQTAARVSRSFSCSSTALPLAAWNPIGCRISWCTFAAPSVVFSSSQARHDLRAACCCTRKAWLGLPSRLLRLP